MHVLLYWTKIAQFRKKDHMVIVWSDGKLKISIQFLAPPNILPPNYHSYNYNEHQDKGNQYSALRFDAHGHHLYL
jgi:hypothetical protein